MSKERKVVDTFKVTVKENGKDQNEVEFAVVEPSLEDHRKARMVYNTAFGQASKSGAPLREKLDDLLKEQGLFNENLDAEVEVLQRNLIAQEQKLVSGGISLEQGKDLAISIAKLRIEMGKKLAPRQSLDINSAQGQAENEQFNCLVSLCLVYNDTKKPRYDSLEDYLNGSKDEEAFSGAQALANRLYGVDKDFEKGLTENRFLRQFGFMNEEGALTDREGNLILEDGTRYTESGDYINDDGEKVDRYGNRLTESGDYFVQATPFTDENGKPVSWDSYGSEAKADEAKADEVEPVAEPEAVVAE
tara:strand:+ start:6559 stop:7470 length:912 start_codon:yes stop_codon:yes gene_type:complete